MEHKCCSKQKVKRGLWSPEEDEKLLKYITRHGHSSWCSLPELAGLERCGKSCRLRWINYLRPELKEGSFKAEEEQIIIDVHRMLGNRMLSYRWAQIARHLPGRTDNEVKNYWNSCIKKKLIAQGIDPKTHHLMRTSARSNSLRPEKKWKTSVLNRTSQISYIPTDMNPSLEHTHFQQPTQPPTPEYRKSDHVNATKHQTHGSEITSLTGLSTSLNLAPTSGFCNKMQILETSYAEGISEAPMPGNRAGKCLGMMQIGRATEYSCTTGNSSSVMEDSFDSCRFDLDFAAAINCMDDLEWNSGFAS